MPVSTSLAIRSTRSAVVLRLVASSFTVWSVSAPALNICCISTESWVASVSPGFSAGAAVVPMVISTILSPRRPWVEILASESRRTRSEKRRAIVIVTRTLPPGFSGSSTAVTRPICTPARRTVAPSMSPPTSPNSATRSYLRSK